MRKKLSIITVIILIMGFQLAGWAKQTKPAGKFYIVGMGTEADLITLRALEVIKKAELILLENEYERDMWKDLIGAREVWVFRHSARIGLGIDPKTIKDPKRRKLAEKNRKIREETVKKITEAVYAGKSVAYLQSGDAMIYGTTYHLELLPSDIPTEIVPGVGSFQAATAAVKMSPTFGYDTSSVIITMDDWPGRKDVNEKLMALNSSMIVYTMHLDYPDFFGKLARHYPSDTPVAVVCYAGSPEKQKVIKSTVGKFLKEVAFKKLPPEEHILLIGRFITAGQARKDGLKHGSDFIRKRHDPPGEQN
ncbi:MAG TPA: SAM-dependent methyltransferase [Spirochaetota bacterium]|nr:SAM-dependent methyltransferase [Spirochaetota bacterium]HPI90351.1 SAM-dependent methyltransferase [Spirochaetota bacterium]HPR48481.1 SAM-dependent methyltransferase [Spirochaetota bacterium]